LKNRAYAVVLGALALAFSLRVLGQAIVALGQVSFLPPMEQWDSGLVPYPVLLPMQVAILAAQGMVSRDIWKGTGFFALHRPRLGRALRWFSCFYFAAMVLRYILTMTFYPERRWFFGTIPIFFHWVLAGYLFVLGRFCLDETALRDVAKR
jgi:hypothetical protein